LWGSIVFFFVGLINKPNSFITSKLLTMDDKYFSFKKLFLCYLFCAIPFSLLAAFLALFNVVPVELNNSPRYGIDGFIIAILYIPFIGFMFSGASWLSLNFGLWVYKGFLTLTKRK
jgi:hypothetical protein